MDQVRGCSPKEEVWVPDILNSRHIKMETAYHIMVRPAVCTHPLDPPAIIYLHDFIRAVHVDYSRFNVLFGTWVLARMCWSFCAWVGAQTH